MMSYLLVEKSISSPLLIDFSRYGYIYLLHKKSQSMDALEVSINEVERQLDKKMKIVKYDKYRW